MSFLIPLISSSLCCCEPYCNAISNSIIQKFRNVESISENIRSLEDLMRRLNALNKDVMTMVILAERRGLERKEQVKEWLDRVTSLKDEADSIINRLHNSSRCLNLWSSYRLGQRLPSMIQEVQSHLIRGEFGTDVAWRPRPSIVKPMMDISVVGQALELEKLKQLIKEASLIGIYGMGGSGKSTLLKRFNDLFIGSHEYDTVIYIRVSKEPKIEEIQKTIMESLGLLTENAVLEASKIHEALSKMDFLLLLDDVWNNFDEETLDTIGIPRPCENKNCKVVLTTRFEGVCDKMGVGRNKIGMNFLVEDEAWELFKKNSGDDYFHSNPRIEKLARTIVAKCGGLPLALIIIGRALASKVTVEEWMHAESALLDFRASEITGMQENLLCSLKYSYDNLNSDAEQKETMQKCFLYCCLFPQDHIILKTQLVEYWVGEGFLDFENNVGIDRARLKGHNIIGLLRAACLLESGEDQKSVKMHDVIREMARWIANDCTGIENKLIVPAGKRLEYFPEWGKLMKAERISLMHTHVKLLPVGTPGCLNWLTLLFQGLLFQGSTIQMIPSEIFQYISSLKVLDISYCDINELPAEIKHLVNLHYLNMSVTGIESLPRELGELKSLRQLYLNDNRNLKRIPQEAICRLSMLEVLDLTDTCYPMADVGCSNDLRLNHLNHMIKLKDLRLHIKYSVFVNQFVYTYSLQEITSDLRLSNDDCHVITLDLLRMSVLKNFHLSSFSNLVELNLGGKYSGLKLESLRLEGIYELRKISVCMGQYTEILQNLCHLVVVYCRNLDITWLHQLPCLETVEFRHVFNVELLTVNEEASAEAFPNLKSINVQQNDQMERLCQHTLHLPSLEYLEVIRCPNLKNLSLGPRSAPHLKEIKGTQEWWDELSWDDEQTKQVFSGRFRRVRE